MWSETGHFVGEIISAECNNIPCETELKGVKHSPKIFIDVAENTTDDIYAPLIPSQSLKAEWP